MVLLDLMKCICSGALSRFCPEKRPETDRLPIHHCRTAVPGQWLSDSGSESRVNRRSHNCIFFSLPFSLFSLPSIIFSLPPLPPQLFSTPHLFFSTYPILTQLERVLYSAVKYTLSGSVNILCNMYILTHPPSTTPTHPGCLPTTRPGGPTRPHPARHSPPSDLDTPPLATCYASISHLRRRCCAAW